MSGLKLGPVTTTPFIDVDEDSEDDIRERVKDWFLENFEDPAHSTPHDSAEGGYHWIWGGPHDVREVLDDHFFEIPSDLLEEIIDELEAMAVDWAPHEDRIIPDDDDSYEQLQVALDEVADLLKDIQLPSPMIGGNGPPEEIGLPPYGEEENERIREAMAVLRQPRERLIANRQAGLHAANQLRTTGQKLMDFCQRHGETFAENFASQLGKRAADSLTAGFWLKLAGGLFAVYEMAKMFFAG
ncbi:hypothetical protein MUO32_22365 [Shinella sp. CPCC 101442]|uniref:hypothetical protein n=1 Tax=Shinella sp. CPCC 101442 TaxID=2932265 RepID=UPI002153697C|nr:hypothetical protein [Shinella sp. CPCC 101442]MCR6501787.1 hypothetical protein [Shinella sp. CPCC 101442]